MAHTTWHYVTRHLPGIGVVLTIYDAFGNEIEEVVADTLDDALEQAKTLAEAAGATLEVAARAIANATLDVVRGLGAAVVDGLDSAYDATRAKLEGREPDVIAGIVVVALTILTVTYIFNSAKAKGDAF